MPHFNLTCGLPSLFRTTTSLASIALGFFFAMRRRNVLVEAAVNEEVLLPLKGGVERIQLLDLGSGCGG